MAWQNPYIEKLKEHSGLIIGTSDLALSEAEKRRLESLISLYPALYVELGSGSGGHLISQAARSPNALFVGFELRFKRAVKTAQKAKRLNLSNVVVLRTNAQALPELVPQRSIDGLYVNFPDPWARERWRKHRLLSKQFIKALSPVMKPKAFISYKTDHRESFQATQENIMASGGFTVEHESNDLYQSHHGVDQVKSEFEKLFISKGMPIHYLRAVHLS